MRLVFMGTPDYAVPSLKKLHELHEIVMVYTQPDRPKGRGYQLSASPVKQTALELGLPLRQPTSLRSADEQALLRELAPDVIVVIAYGLLLPKAVLEIPRFGCINAHGSLLPKHRGASPMQQAILEGDEQTGVTTMLMNEGMDTGDILLIAATPLRDKGIEELHDELAGLSADLLVRTLDELEQGTLQPVAQDDQLASYTKKISKADGLIDWSHSAKDIVNQWRAYGSWPGVMTLLHGEPLKLSVIAVLPKSTDQPAGTVITASESGIDVATGSGVIRIMELQPPGKRRMKVADYLRGNALKEGTTLGN